MRGIIDEYWLNPPEEPKPLKYCPTCGTGLYEGDKIYFGEFCDECIDDYITDNTTELLGVNI